MYGDKEKKTKTCLPLLKEYWPIYATLPPLDIEACCNAVLEGAELPNRLKDKEKEWLSWVCDTAFETESVCADFVTLDTDARLAYPIDELSDFSLSSLSVMLTSSPDDTCLEKVTTKMDDMLWTALSSNTATPLLNYEWMFRDAVSFRITEKRGADPVWTLKRSAAHDVRHNDGRNIPNIFSHMACVCLEQDKFHEAVRIYAALLKYAPGRLEIVYSLAMDLAQVGCFDAAAKIGKYLTEHRDSHKRPSVVCPNIKKRVDSWARLCLEKNAVPFEPALYTVLDDILYSSSPGAPNMARLVQDVIPEIDTIPVKEPLP